jgi:hypothetical protein
VFVLTNVAGALVTNVGPTTVAGCPSTREVRVGPLFGPAIVMARGATAGEAVAAPAVAIGAAMAIVVSAAATPMRRVLFGFISDLPFSVEEPPALVSKVYL